VHVILTNHHNHHVLLPQARTALSSKAGASDTAVALASKADLGFVNAQLRDKVIRAVSGAVHVLPSPFALLCATFFYHFPTCNSQPSN